MIEITKALKFAAFSTFDVSAGLRMSKATISVITAFFVTPSILMLEMTEFSIPTMTILVKLANVCHGENFF